MKELDMQPDEIKALSNIRFEHALDVLNEAKVLLANNNIKVPQIVHIMRYFTQ